MLHPVKTLNKTKTKTRSENERMCWTSAVNRENSVCGNTAWTVLPSKVLYSTVMGIPVLHDSIGGSGWDLISGGKRVGERASWPLMKV